MLLESPLNAVFTYHVWTRLAMLINEMRNTIHRVRVLEFPTERNTIRRVLELHPVRCASRHKIIDEKDVVPIRLVLISI